MTQEQEQPPAQAEWRQLYETAIRFRELAPWQWMWDGEQFGVKDPESGEIGYCCIMGRLGEHFALAVYEGREGLAGLQKMRTEGPHENYLEVMMLQKCLMASFEDREMLETFDRDQIKELGFKFRGRGAWPQFRSYLPGYQPWYLTAPQARFLTAALEQSMEVAQRVKTNPALLPNGGYGSEFLVRVPHGTAPNITWEDSQVKPAPLPRKRIPIVPLSPEQEAQARTLKRLPKTRGILELDTFLMPGAVRGEEGGRPYFPSIILAADQDSGTILTTDIVKTEEAASGLIRTLLNVLQDLEMLPARVEVGNAETLVYLEAVCALLGVRLTQPRRLKALPEAYAELTAFMRRGGPPGL